MTTSANTQTLAEREEQGRCLNRALQAIEREILAAEGPWHVEGRYIRDERLAGVARRRAAERVLLDRERQRKLERARERTLKLMQLEPPTAREIAEAQRRQFEATGIPGTGYESFLEEFSR